MRRPDLPDLERAIREFRDGSTASTAGDEASRYEQRILRSLEDVVRRERESGAAMRASARARLGVLLGRDVAGEDLEAELCRRLASGGIDESNAELMRHLRAETVERLEIDNPRYWSLAAAKARLAR